MGGELFLASVAGCFLSTLLAAIKTRGLAPSTIETEVVGTLAESPAHFSAIEIQVFAPDLPDLDKLLEIADRSCIMTNTLRGTLPVRIGIR
jgi:putative redox protein